MTRRPPADHQAQSSPRKPGGRRGALLAAGTAVAALIVVGLWWMLRNPAAATYGYEVVAEFPHDSRAFTQGLVFHEGFLLEGTGREGASTLRRVELQTGRVVESVELSYHLFGEGVTVMGDRVYQVTWQNRAGLVYDVRTLQKVGDFRFGGEGWGLTNDGESLILSDGSNVLRFIDPHTFNVVRRVEVMSRGAPVRQLNELEYVKGEIWANVFHTDRIARIDPAGGRVTGWIDLSGLRPADARDEEAVLNGIAYDKESGRLFVTGKLWSRLFEIRVVPR